jgi:pimeloyl-ACP methyl ester carboxylesterase
VDLGGRLSVVIQESDGASVSDVLFIPGLASSDKVFAQEASLLRTGHRVHLIQVAGFAGKPAGLNASGPLLGPIIEDLHHYISTNHLRRVALIGHSFGGLIALMLADAHPEDVDRLLIVDTLPFYGMVFDPNATVDSIRPQAKAMHDGFLSMSSEQFAASQPQFAARLVTSPENVKVVVAGSVQSDRAVFAEALLEDLGTDIRPRLSSIKTPMTLLYPYSAVEGSKEEVTALYTNAYHDKPNISYVCIADSLHFIMFDQPNQFHHAVLMFLAPHPADGSAIR